MRKAVDFLVVEDDANDVFLIQRAFSKGGSVHRLHIVGDGQEAVEYLTGHGRFADRSKYPLPGVILLDIKMPRMTGLDFLEWLSKQPDADLRLIPVIVMSSSDQGRDVKRAYELGANCYLVKPVPWKEFEERMKTIDIFWGEHVVTPVVGS